MQRATESGAGARLWERLWAASGALAILLFAGGLLFGDLLGSTNFPPLDASSEHVRRYFLDNASEVRALSFFHTLAALALLGFSAYLTMSLRREQPERGGLPGVALAGGVAAAVFLLLSAIFYRVLAEPVVAKDSALAHATLVASYLAGGPAISAPLALLIGAAVPGALRGSLLPRWLGGLGIASVLACVASTLTMLGPANNRSASYGVLLLAAVLGFGWITAASLTLAVQARPRGASPDAGSK